jgi:hypothetical protein
MEQEILIRMQSFWNSKPGSTKVLSTFLSLKNRHDLDFKKYFSRFVNPDYNFLCQKSFICPKLAPIYDILRGRWYWIDCKCFYNILSMKIYNIDYITYTNLQLYTHDLLYTIWYAWDTWFSLNILNHYIT